MATSISNDHNVYILGAGFSRDAGYPLVADFMSRMRDAHDWLRVKRRRLEANSIARVLDFRLEATSSAYRVDIDLDNIEELFSLAAALQRSALERDIRIAIGATLDFASATRKQRMTRISCKTLKWRVPPEWKPEWPQGVVKGQTQGRSRECLVPIYQAYLATMCGLLSTGRGGSARNTIITFNYDTLVEESLLALRAAFDYGFAPETEKVMSVMKALMRLGKGRPVSLLKMHGSINWSHDPGEKRALTGFPTYGDVISRGAAPLLVPPTFSKQFQEQLSHVWAKAINALSTATRVVIIGYSMPPTDIHFKYLLAAGMRSNISLRQIHFVNPLAEGDLNPRLLAVLRREFLERKIVVPLAQFTNVLVANPGFLAEIGRSLPADVFF